MIKLTPQRLDKLNVLTLNHLAETNWPKIKPNQQERSLTHNVVGPRISELLTKIAERQLVLRYDGEISPRAIVRHGMSFAPDLEVSLYSQRCLAVEVKILRDSDASGSLSKAIGQTLMYRALGFEISIGLIFDCRKQTKTSLRDSLQEISDENRRVSYILV